MPVAHPDAVCADCIEDPALKRFVAANLSDETCGFCEQTSTEPIAADLSDLISEIVSGIEHEWTDPANELAWESAEGGYQGDTYDGHEIFDVIGWPFANDRVGDAVMDALSERSWCEKDYYAGPKEARLSYGWADFRERVKHQIRYFFLTPGRDSVAGPADYGPAQVLDELGKAIEAAGLLRALEAGQTLHRARVHPAAKTMRRASQLGTPPADRAAYANRASAAGVPMFYGALDPDTAVAETIGAGVRARKAVTIGKFITARAVSVIDLSAIPKMPSLFDRERRGLRSTISFLSDFAADYSATVEKDGREHIDYVPTQVVTEYFRHVFRPSIGGRVLGIKFRSARRKGGLCCVLFCESENCVDATAGWEATPDSVLGLSGVTRRSAVNANLLLPRRRPLRKRR